MSRIPSVAWLVLLLGIPGGILILVLTPPFQAPDEPAHFFRAWQISEGRFVAQTDRDELPASLPALANRFTAQREHFSPQSIRESMATGLRPEERAEVAFPGTARYTAIPYLPQVLGLVAGRIFRLPPIGLLYAARLFNLLICGAIVFAAIRLSPFFRVTLSLVALLPMALFLRSTASADGLYDALSLLLLAAILSLVFGSRLKVGRKRLVVLGASFAISLCKPSLLPLLALMIPKERFRSSRSRGVFIGTLLLLWLAGSAVVVQSARQIEDRRTDSDPVRQARFIASHPLDAGAAVVRDYRQHYGRYIAESIGNFGWLDAPLPPLFVVVYAGMMILFALFDTDWQISVRAGHRFFLLLVAAATLVLISLSLYILWSPPGSELVQGIQGRYFIPIIPVGLLVLYNRRLRTDLERQSWMPAVALLMSIAVSCWTLYARYWR